MILKGKGEHDAANHLEVCFRSPLPSHFSSYLAEVGKEWYSKKDRQLKIDMVVSSKTSFSLSFTHRHTYNTCNQAQHTCKIEVCPRAAESADTPSETCAGEPPPSQLLDTTRPRNWAIVRVHTVQDKVYIMVIQQERYRPTWRRERETDKQTATVRDGQRQG